MSEQNVSFSEAKRVVERALDERKLALLVGNCVVRYDGRAASKLSEGDRLLVIKPDGTFLVHQSTKMAAINYQGPGARVSVNAGDEALVVKAERSKPLKETIEVFFKSVQFAGVFKMKDDSKLKLFGSERELSDLLMQDLDLIEPGLMPLKQESDVRKGSIDILARDALGKLVAIELKRRRAGLDAVTQLHRYVHELSERKDARVRGILCAPAITPNAYTMLEKSGLEFFRLDYEIGNPSAKIKGLEKKQKTISQF